MHFKLLKGISGGYSSKAKNGARLRRLPAGLVCEREHQESVEKAKRDQASNKKIRHRRTKSKSFDEALAIAALRAAVKKFVACTDFGQVGPGTLIERAIYETLLNYIRNQVDPVIAVLLSLPHHDAGHDEVLNKRKLLLKPSDDVIRQRAKYLARAVLPQLRGRPARIRRKGIAIVVSALLSDDRADWCQIFQRIAQMAHRPTQAA